MPVREPPEREKEARGRRVITYCAGCVNFLNPRVPATHILDLMFESEGAMRGKAKVSKAPFTYFNRLRLKKRFEATIKATVTRERRPDKV